MYTPRESRHQHEIRLQDLVKSVLLEARNGDEKAIEELCRVCTQIAFNICIGRLRNIEDAEDAASEAIRRLYRSIKNFDENSKFSTWFYQICFNVCNSVLEERRREWLNNPRFRKYVYDETVHQESVEQHLQNIVQIRYYRELLDRLHQHPGFTIAVLKYLEQKSWDEIAAITKCSASMCQYQLKAFRKKAKALESEGNQLDIDCNGD